MVIDDLEAIARGLPPRRLDHEGTRLDGGRVLTRDGPAAPPQQRPHPRDQLADPERLG